MQGEPAPQHHPQPNASAAEARIACVDFNGVLDAYTGWRGADHFDPPRAGARSFLEALVSRGFRIVVFTTRWPDDVWRWLREHGLEHLVERVTDRKPAAHVFVDDRAVCFRGDFDETLREIDSFVAHWE
jgi:FMN phosphatase YigB (HAD superfamily)